MSEIYTRNGDTGTTNLLYGGVVNKDDLRIETCGCIDEVVSALGMFRASCDDKWAQKIVEEIQRELFTVGAEIATVSTMYSTFKKHFEPISPERTKRLESEINRLTKLLKLPQKFIIPGNSIASATLDVARTLARRAERSVVRLKNHSGITNDELIKYLNRLSDFLFICARYVDRDTELKTLN